MPDYPLEPVTPDPKKLRRTALILVAIMILGGIVILRAYEKRTEEGEKDSRPSFVTQITEAKDLRFVRQDGKMGDLMSLKGKVLVVQCLPQSQPDAMTTGVMKRLSEKYAGESGVALVTLMLDPGPAEGLKGELEKLAGGLGAGLPQWTVGSTERATLHKFIKNEFKANMLPHEDGGKWVYDGSLVVIDKSRRVRRAVIPQVAGGAAYVAAFDFAQAQEWDEKGIKTSKEPGAPSNVSQLETLLGDTVGFLLKEENEPEKQPNLFLYTAIGFALLCVLLIVKSRAAREGPHP